MFDWIPGRTPPQSKTTDELIQIREKKVYDFEINNVNAQILDLYKKYYQATYLSISKHQADKTAVKRIIATCAICGWDVGDYLDQNFKWYTKNSRHKPLPRNMCGPVAQLRYQSYLADHGYYDGYERMAAIAAAKESRQQVKRMEANGQLPFQKEKAANEYANIIVSKMKIDISQPIPGVPGYIYSRWSEEKKIQMWGDRLRYQAKQRYLKGSS